MNDNAYEIKYSKNIYYEVIEELQNKLNIKLKYGDSKTISNITKKIVRIKPIDLDHNDSRLINLITLLLTGFFLIQIKSSKLSHKIIYETYIYIISNMKKYISKIGKIMRKGNDNNYDILIIGTNIEKYLFNITRFTFMELFRKNEHKRNNLQNKVFSDFDSNVSFYFSKLF